MNNPFKWLLGRRKEVEPEKSPLDDFTEKTDNLLASLSHLGKRCERLSYTLETGVDPDLQSWHVMPGYQALNESEE